ncbi:GNAT family N-acetyltransferase [Arsukibacterium sp. UBA3155]|uniref:GNAT family N-acetyltransferase n=1 Tax=Arsukibacterium sp. UBA3155 TaxID=1946058 RepID=UPI0025C06316|nr:GNAT family protein [Arsukibacterium sp. UBA3155]|tara:strand:+ start:2031 stop:2588 length:558 start_codon:yes stop_codon:yes gene_type:complete
MQFPELETSRLILNQLSKDDGQALLNIFADDKVVKYYDIDVYTSEEQSLELIDFFNNRFIERAGIRWAIRVKDTGKLIGTCGFNSLSQKMKNAGIGYELSSNYWGLGYATEAICKIIELAFSNESPFGEIYRIQGDTMIGNLASETVLKKLGFKEEGVRRSSGFWKNEFHDLKCFGLIKPEFKEI